MIFQSIEILTRMAEDPLRSDLDRKEMLTLRAQLVLDLGEALMHFAHLTERAVVATNTSEAG